MPHLATLITKDWSDPAGLEWILKSKQDGWDKPFMIHLTGKYLCLLTM